jgi:hypothetical protein
MLTEPTLTKLRALRLEAFAAAWAEQHKNPELAKLSFDERLGLLVDAECLARENKRLTRLLKETSFASARHASRRSTSRPDASSTSPSCGSWPRVAGCTSTRTHRHRRHRHRQDLRRVRPGPAGLPQGLLRDLPPGGPALRRTRACPRRGQLRAPAGQARTRRRAGDRRLGPDARARAGASRFPRDPGPTFRALPAFGG